jgi:hypothetical protein
VIQEVELKRGSKRVIAKLDRLRRGIQWTQDTVLKMESWKVL